MNTIINPMISDEEFNNKYKKPKKLRKKRFKKKLFRTIDNSRQQEIKDLANNNN